MSSSNLGFGQTYATFASWVAAVQSNTGAEDAVCSSGSDLGDLLLVVSDEETTWVPSSSVISVAEGHKHNGKDEGTTGVAYTGGDIYIEASGITVRHLRIDGGTFVINSQRSGTWTTLVEENLFSFTGGGGTRIGILAADGGGVLTIVSSTWRNNLIYYNPTGGPGDAFIASNTQTGDTSSTIGLTFVNNTILSTNTLMDNGLTFAKDFGVLNVVLRNNIVLGANTACYTNAGASITASNNLSSDATAALPGSTNHKINQVAATVVTNPTNDATLPLTSPAYDAGATLVGFATDVIGTARPQHGLWDMGAFERIFVAPPANATHIIKPARIW